MSGLVTVIHDNLTALTNNPLFVSLMLLILADYATGVIKAIVLRVLDSRVGLHGILLHCAVVVSVMCIWIFSATYDAHYVGNAINLIFCVNYICSIMENLIMMGAIKNERIVKIFQKKIDKYLSKFEEEGT